MRRKRRTRPGGRFLRHAPLLGLGSLAAVAVGCRESNAPTAPAVVHAGYYVSPGGSSHGDGTWQQPWDLATAFDGAGGRIQPGDTVWLRGGRYVGPFVSRLTGTAAAPVIVRQFPRERATLDNSSATLVTLKVGGQWTWYWGFEVTNSNPDRFGPRPNGVYPSEPNNRFINLVVHDNAVGISFSTPSAASEIYGCLIYDNGYDDSDRTHGHGIYAKNNGPLPKLIRDNVVFDQFRNGIQIFTDSGTDQLKDFLLEGNVWFNNGTLTSTNSSAVNILVGGHVIADQITMVDNLTYFSPGLDVRNVRIGYDNTLPNGTVTLQDNYFIGGTLVLAFSYWDRATVSGNVLYGNDLMVDLTDSSLAGQSWSGNTYLRDPAAAAWRYAGTSYAFAGWQQATSLSADDVAEAGAPSATRVFIRPNAYEAGRANIIVYNWGHESTVSVDLSAVLQPGDPFEIHNVQDYYGAPVLAGTYDGGSVALPMGGVNPPRPIGGSPNTPPRTGPEFDVFILTLARP